MEPSQEGHRFTKLLQGVNFTYVPSEQEKLQFLKILTFNTCILLISK